MKKTPINYLLLTGYSIVLSIVAYLIIYAPIMLLNIFSGDTLGGFIFMLFISVFVVRLNTVFIFYILATSLLGALAYYFVFSVLFVKLYGVMRKRG